MHSLDLPVLPEDAPLATALSTLARQAVSAVLVKSGGVWQVLDEKSLTRKGNTTQTLLREIAARTADSPIAVEVEEEGAALDDEVSRMGVVVLRPKDSGPTPRRRRLVTRQLDMAVGFSQAIRYCTCANGHVWAPGEPLIAGICDICQLPLTCK